MDLGNYYYIFLLFGVSQGIFLTAVIPSTKSANHPANKILALIILFATIMLSGRILYSSLSSEWVIRLAYLVDTTIFLFGPLIYFYTLRLINPRRSFSKLHYVPALTHLIYVGVTLNYSLTELSNLYYNGPLRLILIGIEGLGIISLGSYLFLSFFEIKGMSSSDFLGPKNSLTLKKYLSIFLSIFSILEMIWIVSFALTVSRSSFSFVSYDIFWTITPILFYVVGYFSLSSPEILRIALNKTIADRLKAEEIEELKSNLNVLINVDKVYLNSNLTLKDLAEQLNTSTNNLSWYLNHVHQQSFYDFINHTRINAFQEKIEKLEHQKHTLLALAMDVGFNSKSTFNKAFKSLLGYTPSDYIKNHN